MIRRPATLPSQRMRGKLGTKGKRRFEPTAEEVRRAVQEFQARGGVITVCPPMGNAQQWRAVVETLAELGG